jgi:hypothetical protein
MLIIKQSVKGRKHFIVNDIFKIECSNITFNFGQEKEIFNFIYDYAKKHNIINLLKIINTTVKESKTIFVNNVLLKIS